MPARCSSGAQPGGEPVAHTLRPRPWRSPRTRRQHRRQRCRPGIPSEQRRADLPAVLARRQAACRQRRLGLAIVSRIVSAHARHQVSNARKAARVFDQSARRRRRLGQSAFPVVEPVIARSKRRSGNCHCEKRSDEAISCLTSVLARHAGDCFVRSLLAMTACCDALERDGRAQPDDEGVFRRLVLRLLAMSRPD